MKEAISLKEQLELQIKAFIEKLRPDDLEVRKKLDIGYTFVKQSLIVSEIRPGWKINSDGEHEFDYDKK